MKTKTYIQNDCRILQTNVISFNLEKFAPNYADHDLDRYCYDGKNIGLLCRFWEGVIGLEGTFGLLIPPGGYDVNDAYDANPRIKVSWDGWAFATMTAVAEDEYKVGIRFAFKRNSFFDAGNGLLRYFSADELDAINDGGWFKYVTGNEPPDIDDFEPGLWRFLQEQFDAEEAPNWLQLAAL